MFCPNGATYTITSVASTAVSQSISADTETGAVRVSVEAGSSDLFIAFGSTASSSSIRLLQNNSLEYFKVPAGTTYISIYSDQSGNIVQITVGQDV